MWRVDGVQALDLFSVQQAGAHARLQLNLVVAALFNICSGSQVLSDADCGERRWSTLAALKGRCARTGLEASTCGFHHSLSDARERVPLNLGCLLGMPSVLQAASPRSTKPLLTARRPPLDAEKHAFRAFAGGRISQKK